MAARRNRKKYLMISSVAERFGIHPQTLRLYEREGLLKPVRSAGNTRLYDDSTLRRLETILNLTRELGVNLAGVEVILNMREQLESLQRELDEIRRDHDRREGERRGVSRRYALVRLHGGPLAKR